MIPRFISNLKQTRCDWSLRQKHGQSYKRYVYLVLGGRRRKTAWKTGGVVKRWAITEQQLPLSPIDRLLIYKEMKILSTNTNKATR